MIKFLCAFAIVVATSFFGPVAFAADLVFLPGSRIGLVPLIGLSPAKAFSGFETEDHSVRVLMAELPAAAYREVELSVQQRPEGAAGARPETIETAAGRAYYTVENARDGNTPVRRYSLILSGGSFSGFIAVQVPENASKIYTDDAVRQMFASANLRKEVPVEEQLNALPFKVGDRGNFKLVRTLPPGGAVILADSDEETGIETAPFMVLGVLGGVPERSDDRARFAQQAAAQIPGLRAGRITVAEPIRIDGAPGYETRIEAVSGKNNTPVTVVQWLRFTGRNALRVIGSSPREQWSSAFPRFRTVRDGIDVR